MIRKSKFFRALLSSSWSAQESGQSVIVIALLMVAVIAMLGLVLDGGNTYLQRRRMQNAADGSSMAGAIKLANPVNTSGQTLTGRSLECAIRYEIEKFATLNGVPGPTPAEGCGTYNPNILANFVDANGSAVGTYVGLYYGVPTTAKGISVTVSTSYNTFFLGVVGITNAGASAPAKAAFGTLSSPQSLVPLARRCLKSDGVTPGTSLADCGFTYGATVDLWNGGGPGNFGWLSWSGSNSANYLRDELIPGNPIDYVSPNGHTCSTAPRISPGCWVQGSPGVMATASGNLTTYWVNTGDTMIIPIWDTSQGNGSNVNYHVIGFAAFIVTDFRLTGQGYINGKFVKFVTAGDLCTSNCFDGGLTSIHLRP